MDTFVDNLEPENVEYTSFQCNKNGSSVLISADEVCENLPNRFLLRSLLCARSQISFSLEQKKVAQYVYEESETTDTVFSYIELLRRTVSDSAVLKMEVCPRHSHLVILSKTDLWICDAEQLEIVETFPIYHGISAFQLCYIECEPTKLCLAFVTQLLQIYNMNQASLCVGEGILCIASGGRYLSFNLHTREAIELFKYDENRVKPFLAHVSKNEFLISGPDSLGVIVDTMGISKRPPLQLSPNVLQVFVWSDYLFTVTDEFFTIHSVPNQSQLQTVPLNNIMAACFTAGNPRLIFLATRKAATNLMDLIAIGPERWDRFARKLVLADCARQAEHLLSVEQRRVDAVSQQRPASSKSIQNLFVTRSRRLCGLLGFYYFEKGEFPQAEQFFEKSLIDIRELLFRYADLLPSGYHFEPNSFYTLCNQLPEDHSSVTIRQVAELCLILSMHDVDAALDPHQVVKWSEQYDLFLFGFLQKHHKSKFTEPYLHLLETALVKLYVRLSRRGLKPTLTELILPCGYLDSFTLRSSGMTDSDGAVSYDLVDLISSLVHIDVDDLTSYLQKSDAHHALALIYQWQGNLPSALTVWQKLAYGELEDGEFPGVQFYVAVLRWLVSSNCESAKTTSRPGCNEYFSESPIYVELVWEHFCQAVDSGQLDIAEKFLFSVSHAYRIDKRISNSPVHERKSSPPERIDSSLAPSQLLTPMNLLKKLIPNHLDIGRRYLVYLIYECHETAPELHNFLAGVYLDLISKHLREDQSAQPQPELRQLR
ncbi:tgf beta receptor associated protein-1 [Paragonimus westermani]|uniref:Tgf beta receptor associated protein-1 n=1 Tax=Paragonimus westermani TaxID=34504 RepID=A0A8T0DKB3_9TREM|nr:tgf beta receptor associated protein-1 [Paragonimus westermani]